MKSFEQLKALADEGSISARVHSKDPSITCITFTVGGAHWKCQADIDNEGLYAFDAGSIDGLLALKTQGAVEREQAIIEAKEGER